MNQILHIFKKDTRRFWPEILLTVMVAAVFALVYPIGWMVEADARIRQLQGLANAFTVLVPVTWWLLIGRVVQAESLVGDKQFWLTRPYEWKKLVGAKLLFLLVWLYVPLLLAQMLLLREAGFHPLSYIPGLLFNLLLTTGILVMPLFAMAAVTANFARMTLTLLGVLIAVLMWIFVANTVSSNRVSLPDSDRISLPLVLCLCLAAIVLQYAVRKVMYARMLLIAAPVLVAATLFGLSKTENYRVKRAYPVPVYASAAPFGLRMEQDPVRVVTRPLADAGGQDYIEIPLRVSGVSDGFAVQTDNVRATFTGRDGFSWTSPWEAIYSRRYLAGSALTTLPLRIDRAAYDHLKSGPMDVRLTFALTRLRAGRVTNAVFSARDIELAGFGICATSGETEFRGYSPELSCRSAMHEPQLTYIDMVSSDGPCSSTPGTPEHTAEAYGWAGVIDPDLAEFGITSVWTPSLNLNNRRMHNGSIDENYTRWHVCPGSPLTLTEYHLVDRTQSEFTLTNFVLPATVHGT